MTRMKAAKFCAVFSHGEQGRSAPDLKIVVVAASRIEMDTDAR
jgi:hypothetical protein